MADRHSEEWFGQRRQDRAATRKEFDKVRAEADRRHGEGDFTAAQRLNRDSEKLVKDFNKRWSR